MQLLVNLLRVNWCLPRKNGWFYRVRSMTSPQNEKNMALPVHRFQGILRSLILIFHFRFPLNVSGAQERERLEIESIASTVCSFRSPDTHTHTCANFCQTWPVLHVGVRWSDHVTLIFFYILQEIEPSCCDRLFPFEDSPYGL